MYINICAETLLIRSVLIRNYNYTYTKKTILLSYLKIYLDTDLKIILLESLK